MSGPGAEGELTEKRNLGHNYEMERRQQLELERTLCSSCLSDLLLCPVRSLDYSLAARADQFLSRDTIEPWPLGIAFALALHRGAGGPAKDLVGEWGHYVLILLAKQNQQKQQSGSAVIGSPGSIVVGSLSPSSSSGLLQDIRLR
ncbi:hypothetical protein WN944_023904 [Citrus x changshan-huyou]|uniref:Uncharacterized protein n=1 Tax=Citrus x changshan-huyou TaxID=2935761 RepID=A0AAP0QBH4_9ROSI